MTTTIIAGDLKTGLIRQRAIPVRSASVESVLNQAGQITAAVRLPMIDPLTGSEVPFVQQVQEGRSFLAYVQDGAVLNAGPIWNSSYDDDTHIWSLQAQGMLSMFAHLFIGAPASWLNSGQTDFSAQSVTYSGLSYRTIVKRIAQEVSTWGSQFLPIDYEADIAGSNSSTYQATALKDAASAMTDISALVGGPDIELRPYITSDGDYVRWNLITGNTEISAQASGLDPWVWLTGGPKPSATGVTVTRDASTLATDFFELGSQSTDSSGNATTLADRELNTSMFSGAPGLPRMHASESRSSVTDPTTLNGYAVANLASGQYLTNTWAFSSRIDAEPKLWRLRQGDHGVLTVQKHPLIGSGGVPVRIMSIAVSFGDSAAKIATAPVRS